MDQVKYPNIKVKLVGTDGNAFSILGRIMEALRRDNVSPVERQQFYAEATSGDYDHLLGTCMKWVTVD